MPVPHILILINKSSCTDFFYTYPRAASSEDYDDEAVDNANILQGMKSFLQQQSNAGDDDEGTETSFFAIQTNNKCSSGKKCCVLLVLMYNREIKIFAYIEMLNA